MAAEALVESGWSGEGSRTGSARRGYEQQLATRQRTTTTTTTTTTTVTDEYGDDQQASRKANQAKPSQGKRWIRIRFNVQVQVQVQDLNPNARLTRRGGRGRGAGDCRVLPTECWARSTADWLAPARPARPHCTFVSPVGRWTERASENGLCRLSAVGCGRPVRQQSALGYRSGARSTALVPRPSLHPMLTLAVHPPTGPALGTLPGARTVWVDGGGFEASACQNTGAPGCAALKWLGACFVVNPVHASRARHSAGTMRTRCSALRRSDPRSHQPAGVRRIVRDLVPDRPAGKPCLECMSTAVGYSRATSPRRACPGQSSAQVQLGPSGFGYGSRIRPGRGGRRRVSTLP